jgi:diguanylate cyclase (GGDEF)-like protein/putative nucleotidyltransferase with HDIG domain
MGRGRAELVGPATKESKVEPKGRLTRETTRLLPLVLPVSVGGAAVVFLAAFSFGASDPTASTLAGVWALLVVAALAEAFPVPLEKVPVGGTSLATIFIVATSVIYGWEAATLNAFLAMIVVEVARRQPLTKVAYNSGVYALAASTTSAATLVDGGQAFGWLFPQVLVASAAFYIVDLVLVALAVSRSAREPFFSLLKSSVSSTLIAFSIMASLSLLLAVLWERNPFLSAALVGPVVAIALYQRSVHRELRAMRLALTDPLTGLGNHRYFYEQLERALHQAESSGVHVALCLFDIDDFKRVNDAYGHPIGDEVLVAVASRLRRDGEAFRLGGDEFALLLVGQTEEQAVHIAHGVLARAEGVPAISGESLSLSAGVALYPAVGVERSELVRVADSALYLAKEHGKNRVRVYRPDLLELAELRRLAEGPDRAARLRAAASLAHAVDARDAYTGSHSYMVGELAARVAKRMGLESEQIELARLAGSLHDLGKLAIPEEILRKPGPLNEAERLVLERHPQIGFRMLDSLGVEPVASWVLHHHERWDGDGYPDRLGGERIPLGSRILFVADAYDAMTSERVYRSRLTHERAISELERCAGTQFDPDVVSAFKEEFDEPRRPVLVAVESA